MKKILFISMALVLALGTLGLGYSMWTSSAIINGKITTGNVQIGIVDLGTNDPSTTIPSYDPLCDPVSLEYYGVPGTTPYTGPETIDPKDVASADSANGTEVGSSGYYSSITENITNAYPGYAPTSTIEIASSGSVPVKIGIDISQVSGTNDLSPWMDLSWTISGTGAVADGIDGSSFGSFADLFHVLQGAQIDQGQTIKVVYTTRFAEVNPFPFWDATNIFTPGNLQYDVGAETMPQGLTDQFTITVTGAQWNEWTPPSSPTNWMLQYELEHEG